MTQSDLYARPEAPSANRDLWVAGVVILAVVFIPTVIAFTASLFVH